MPTNNVPANQATVAQAGGTGGAPVPDPQYQQYYNQYSQQYQNQQQHPPQQQPRKIHPQQKRRPPKKKSGIGRIIAIAILLILLLTVIANRDTIMDLLGPGTQIREYPEEVRYIITRTVTITGNDDYRLNYLRVPVPDDIPSGSSGFIQEVHESTHTESAYTNFTEDTESDMWGGGSFDRTWWNWTQPASVSGTTIVTKTHEITSKTVRWDYDAGDTATVSDLLNSNDQSVVNLRNRYLGDEWKITPSDPLIQAEADRIMDRVGENAYNVIREAYLFLDHNFEYQTGVQNEPKDAVETLTSRKGDCDDQSILLASILRACGIPAWLEIGGLYDRGAGAWGGHAWMKLWLPMNSKSTGVFDPDSSGTVDIDVVNDEFFFRSCYRYAEWESDGNGAHLEDYYLFVNYIRGSDTSVSTEWSHNEVSNRGTVRYITKDGEVAAPGFEAFAAITTLSLVGLAMRRRKRSA